MIPSGVISNFLVFDRPIIYLSPDPKRFSFDKGDLDESFRAGHTPENLNEMQVAIKESLDHPEQFKDYRKNVRKKRFLALDGKSIQRATDAMLVRYNEYRNIK